MTAPFAPDPDYDAWKKKRDQDESDYQKWLAQHQPPATAAPQAAAPASATTSVGTTGNSSGVAPAPIAGRGGGTLPNSGAELGVEEGIGNIGAGIASFGRTLAEKLGFQRAAGVATDAESYFRGNADTAAATPANPAAGPVGGNERGAFRTATETAPYLAAGPVGGIALGAVQGVGDVREQLDKQGVDQDTRDNAALAIGGATGALWGVVPGQVGGRLRSLFGDAANAVTADAVRELTLTQSAKAIAARTATDAAAMGTTSAIAAAVQTGAQNLVPGATPTSLSDVGSAALKAGVSGAITGGVLGAGEGTAEQVLTPAETMQAHQDRATEAQPVAAAATPIAEPPAPDTPPAPIATEAPAPPAPPGPPVAVEAPAGHVAPEVPAQEEAAPASAAAAPPAAESPSPTPDEGKVVEGTTADVPPSGTSAPAAPDVAPDTTPPVVDQPRTPHDEIESLRNENRGLSQQLYTDDKTGLSNGRAHRAHLDRIASEGTASDHDFLALDMAGLKARNDVDSHAAGDREIQGAASAMAQAADELSIDPRNLYHISGDEFSAIVPKGQGEQLLSRAQELYGERPIPNTDKANRLDGVVGTDWKNADEKLSDFKRNRPIEQQTRPLNAPPESTREAGDVVQVPTEHLLADPERFQFKSNVDRTSGAGNELKGAKWNPELAGVVSAWRDPANGKSYVVNGHHRLDLAKDNGVPSVATHYIDAPDAETARATGALINMAEGRGTATDVAKWMRDTGATREDLESNGVSVRGELARKGLALSKLSPEIFSDVATGKLSEQHGAAIAEVTDDADRQRETASLLRRSGQRLSGPEVAELTKQVVAAGSENVSQETLFGTETENKGLFVDRARVASAIRKKLANDSRLFGFVSKVGRAEQLERAGSTSIDTDAAGALADQSNQAAELFDRLYTRNGPIADAITDAARRVNRGEQLWKVVSDAYEAVRAATVSDRDGESVGPLGDTDHTDPSGEAPTVAAGGASGDHVQSADRGDEPDLFEVGMNAGVRPTLTAAQGPSQPSGYHGPALPATLPDAPGMDVHSRPVTASRFRDALLRLVAPQRLSEDARDTGNSIRGSRAAVERDVAIAINETRRWAKLAGKMTKAQSVAFIDAMERGTPLGAGELAQAGQALRDVYTDYAQRLQSIGRLENARESYVGRIWARDADEVRTAVAGAGGKRPLEGNASFLKQRTYEHFTDGLAAGLTPISYNPFEVMAVKVREMSRVLRTHELLEAEKSEGRGRVVMDMVGQGPPIGADGKPWVRVGDAKDPAFIQYGPPVERISEGFDAMVRSKLNAVIDSLGVQHDRTTNLGGDRLGYSVGPTGDRMATKFGSESLVIEHELGHVLDFKYGLWNKLAGDGTDRGQIKRELRALADRRNDNIPSADLTQGRKEYVRNKYEQIANAVHALIHAPELMQDVAPTVKSKLTAFLGSRPELAPILDIKPSLAVGTADTDLPIAGLRIMGHYYAPSEAAQVWNNALSRGLRGNPIYDALTAPADAAKQAILGLSGFHLATTAKNAIFNDLALGLDRAAHGELSSAPAIGKAAGAPVRLAKVGESVRQAFVDPANAGGEMGDIVNAMTKAGFRYGGRGDVWTGEQWGQMRNAFSRAFNGETTAARAAGLVKGVWHSPWALNESLLRPLFNSYIPRVKAGATYEAVRDALGRMPPGAQPHEITRAVADVVDQMDARFGQVAYDNYFMHNGLKDLAHAMFLAPGWTAGTLKILGETASDVVHAPVSVAKGKLPTAGGSTAFTGAMLMGTMLVGAVTNAVLSGEWPKEMKDYFFPKDGTVDRNGNPNRIDFRTYLTSDFRGWMEHPVKTLINKLSPALHTATDLVRNENYYGDYMYDPNANAGKKILQAGKAAAGELGVPITLRNLQESATRDETSTGKAGNFFGVTPAPRDVVRSTAENEMHDIGQKQGHDKRTPDEAAKADERQQALSDLRNRKNADDVREAFRTGTIGLADEKRVMKEETRGETPFAQQFKRLSLKDAEQVYQDATPAEKHQVARVLMNKRMNNMRARARGEVTP